LDPFNNATENDNSLLIISKSNSTNPLNISSRVKNSKDNITIFAHANTAAFMHHLQKSIVAAINTNSGKGKYIFYWLFYAFDLVFAITHDSYDKRLLMPCTTKKDHYCCDYPDHLYHIYIC